MMENKTAELLAPCGNFDCVIAAINAGADAVYLGGQLFNARAFAANFDREELERVSELCHRFFVKVYITVNTLYKDSEFPELLSFIGDLYAIGVDGLIMQDLGAIAQVRRIWPDMPVHASTQLTASSLDDVRILEDLGLSTVVLSRELNLKEIKEITENSNIRTEVFIHGALCVSYSGQCLMSSVLGNRSGNRGKCAQNCRLNYRLITGDREIAAGHLLSTKDISTLQLLPELLGCGVSSLKIEGRMKTPEYVAGVTGIYRKYLDMVARNDPYQVDPQDILTLRQLFNRGSFSSGYLRTHSGMEMMCPTHPRAWGVPAGKVTAYDRKTHTASIRFEKDMVPGDGIEIRTDTEEGTGSYLNKNCAAGQNMSLRVEGPVQKHQSVWQTYDKRLMDSLKPAYAEVRRKEPMDAAICLKTSQPSVLRVSSHGITAEVSGETPSPAMNQPLTAETVRSQVSKLGGTSWELARFDAAIDDGLFLNRSALNDLKNRAAAALTEKVIFSSQRKGVEPTFTFPEKHPGKGSKQLSVCVRTTGQFNAALEKEAVSRIYTEMNEDLMSQLIDLIPLAHGKNKSLFVKLPRIWRKYIQENNDAWLRECLQSDIDGFLISGPGQYQRVKDSGKKFSLDFTGNVLNSQTFDFWKTLGAEQISVSPEMSLEEINSLPSPDRTEVLVYGYLPLMVTHQCPVGNFAGGKQDRIFCRKRGHKEPYFLINEKGHFPLDTDCRNCICTILSEKPLDIRSGLHAFEAETLRLNFTLESPEETRTILYCYTKVLSSSFKDTETSIYSKSVL